MHPDVPDKDPELGDPLISTPLGKKLLCVVVVIFTILTIMAQKAEAHWQPGTHNATHAILKSWCGRSNFICREGINAISVAKCESAWYWDAGHPWKAVNGQYLGMFQMGDYARGNFGHGPDPWSQSRAAHLYYVMSGKDWSPWECKP